MEVSDGTFVTRGITTTAGRGGTGGTVANFEISSARSRNGAGYLSGLVFSSGSVDRHTYRHVEQA